MDITVLFTQKRRISPESAINIHNTTL
uniref:Uncharacterized protein n=1 Tax=Anguilla anguilla TaxID=7936 RepID=A0A0E9UD14_ANGAN